MANYAERIVKSSIVLLLSTLVASLLGYAIRLILTNQLSVSDYGLFYAVFSFVTLFVMFRDLGFNQALIKYIPEFLAKHDYSRCKRAMMFVYRIQIIITTVFMLLIFLFSDKIALLIFRSASMSGILKLFSLVFLADLFSDIQYYTMLGFQKIGYAFIQTVRNALIVAGLFILMPLDISKTTYAYVFTAFAVPVIFFPFFKQAAGRVLRAKKSEDAMTDRKMIGYAIPVFFGIVAVLVIGNITTVLLQVFRTSEEVGYFQVALPTSQIAIMMAVSFATVFFPLVSELWTKNQKQLLAKSTETSMRFLFMILIPATFMLIAFSDLIINMFFGSAYLPASQPLQLLAIGSLVYAFYLMFSVLFAGIGQPLINTKIGIAAASTSIVAGIILIPSLGANGAALATIAAYLVGALLSWLLISKYIRLHVPKKSLLKSTVNSLVALAFVYYSKNALTMQPVVEAALLSVAAAFIYVVITLVTKNFTKSDIATIEEANLPMKRQISGILHAMIKE